MMKFLKRNEMIKLTGEFRPTVGDVMRVREKGWRGLYKYNTKEAINKLSQTI